MGFKADTSFLRFLTMGAIGVRQTMNQLRSLGFVPIELERYCGSNKIWATKVKRLRMADLLCVKTGLRVEVRAKSDLKIRMSDAPTNPDRRWDTGLRDQDVVAFIAVHEDDKGFSPAKEAVYFQCDTLRDSADTSKLGPPKSASEGAERDRTWPATVPSRSGVVKSIGNGRLYVEMRGDGLPARSQSYDVSDKRVYVAPGQQFAGEASILAGSPASLANLQSYLTHKYDPVAALKSVDTVDRYAAAKAIPYRKDLQGAVAALEALLPLESDDRVALEAAASAATLGSQHGQDRVNAVLWEGARADLRMEAVLILTELGSAFARSELVRVATDAKFKDDEIRQAAIWGLGKNGLKAYAELLPFIDDADEDVAMHAITAFGDDAPKDIIEKLVKALSANDPRQASAASEVLRRLNNMAVAQSLANAASGGGEWIIATLGRLKPDLVKAVVGGTGLMKRVAPLLLLYESDNWLATESRIGDLVFLGKQSL